MLCSCHPVSILVIVILSLVGRVYKSWGAESEYWRTSLYSVIIPSNLRNWIIWQHDNTLLERFHACNRYLCYIRTVVYAHTGLCWYLKEFVKFFQFTETIDKDDFQNLEETALDVWYTVRWKWKIMAKSFLDLHRWPHAFQLLNIYQIYSYFLLKLYAGKRLWHFLTANLLSTIVRSEQ